MSLLVDMMTNTLDEAYAERAGRGGSAVPRSGPTVRRSGSLLTVAVLVALGMLTGTAVAQVRARQEATTGLRAELAEQARERTSESDGLADRTETLREELTEVREAALGAGVTGRRLAERLEVLGLASGTLPVEGPGLVVTVDDPPVEDPATGDALPDDSTPDRRIQDRDLQQVVNGLWAAGAEAVTVNDQRLTAVTAIRSAGEAVLVDLRPLTPPYVVQAVGDPDNLELEFMDGPAGRRLSTLTSLYGIVVEVRRAEDLLLPGGSAPELPASLPSQDEDPAGAGVPGGGGDS